MVVTVTVTRGTEGAGAAAVAAVGAAGGGGATVVGTDAVVSKGDSADVSVPDRDSSEATTAAAAASAATWDWAASS